MLCNLSSYGFEGFRWKFLLRSVGDLPIKKSVQAIFAGLFANEVLPMRGGDLVQAFLGSRFSHRNFAAVVPSIIIGAAMDGLWIVIGIGIIAAFLPLPDELMAPLHWFAGLMIAVAAALGTLMIWPPQGLLKWLARSHGNRGSLIQNFCVQAAESLIHVPPADLAAALLSSGGIPVFQALGFWLFMKAYGLTLPFYAGATVFLLVFLSTALPNTPSNVGSYQFVTVLGLRMFGVEKGPAAGFSIAVFLLVSLPFWLLGPVALARSGLSLRMIRRYLERWIRTAMRKQPA